MEKVTWIAKLSGQIEDLAKEIHLTQEQKERVKDLVFYTARDQYKEGNKAGIRWAKQNTINESE